MIKRILVILLGLMLLCGASAGAEELYEMVNDVLYRIVLRTETEDVTLGSGVLFQDGQRLLTAAGCCAEGELYAIGNDGEHAIINRSVDESAGIAVLQLDSYAAGAPLQMSTSDSQSMPFIFGANIAGRLGSMPLYLARYGRYQGYESMVLSSEEGLLPGAFMTDEQGKIIGLVIAQHTEGVGSYVALDVSTIYSVLMGKKPGTGPFLDISVSWVDGMMKVAWEDEERDSGVYVLTLSGDANAYYTTYTAEKTERSFFLAVPPGHTYYVQVQQAESEEKALPIDWNAMKIFTIPETAFNAYDFTHESRLVSVPAGQVISSELPEMPLTSVDTLTDPKADVYLQIKNTYDVSAEIEVPMALELIAPDGQFFFEEMAYTFMPEYEQEDSFVVSVDSLIASCQDFSGGVFQPGAYVLRYVLGGQIAGEYAFTVEPAGTPGPAAVPETPKTSGFASGVTAVNENGLITLSWDASSIPEGAKVNAHSFYEGNTFTTYHQMLEGASSTQLLAVPGRRTLAWVVWATEGEPAPVMPQNQDEIVLIPATELKPLTDHGFRNLHIGVAASADPEGEASTEFLPEVPITREVLTNQELHFYFQTEDIYQIDETSSDHPMAIVLCTPEGMVFVEPGAYRFDITLQSSDLWLKDITTLFADYESLVQQTWPAGEYRILYIIDEQLAGEYSFTLE